MEIPIKDRNISRCVWCAKALAIFTVIVAHSNFQELDNPWLLIFLQRIGSLGVPVFLLLSAYYYRPTKYSSIFDLLKNKMTIFTPWLIFSMACYFWSSIRMGKEITVLSCLQFVLGYNSLFYFLTVLILLQVFFYFLKSINIRIMTAICILLSIIFTELAAFGVTDGFVSYIGITNYLNIFNWMGFFSIGLFLQTVENRKIIKWIAKSFLWLVLIWVILFAVGFFFEIEQYGYFSIFGIFIEFASVFIILRIAWSLSRFEWIVRLGKYSFPIYLVHINIIPVVNKFMVGHVVGEILSPFFTYLISFFLIWSISKVLKILKLNCITKYLLGVRTE